MKDLDMSPFRRDPPPACRLEDAETESTASGGSMDDDRGERLVQSSRSLGGTDEGDHGDDSSSCPSDLDDDPLERQNPPPSFDRRRAFAQESRDQKKSIFQGLGQLARVMSSRDLDSSHHSQPLPPSLRMKDDEEDFPLLDSTFRASNRSNLSRREFFVAEEEEEQREPPSSSAVAPEEGGGGGGEGQAEPSAEEEHHHHRHERQKRRNSLTHNNRQESRMDMIQMGIASRDSFRRMQKEQEKAKRLEELGLTPDDVSSSEEETDDDSDNGSYLDVPEQGLLEEGQNYLAMSMLVYIYALLREMAVLGYTETDFRAIDVNRWMRWYEEEPPEDSEEDDTTCDGSSVRSDDYSYDGDEGSVARSSVGGTRASGGTRRTKLEKYLRNTRTAGSIIRCVLEELEREYQRAEQEDEDAGSGAGQHDISVIKEFQHWVDDSRCDQEDDAAEKAIKELQRQVAKKRWKRAVQAVMARSRFKFILAAAKAARETEREEREGKKEEKTKEESVREKMERKKEAVRLQLQKEMMEKGNAGNVNSWFTLQKRVIQSHFDDEAGADEETREENAKRRPHKSMIDKVVEQSLPSFFKPGSVLNLMMEQGVEVVYFGDRHPNEAIYCVCVCRRTRTVTVIFRGSVTAHNWMYNMKLMMSDQPNPLAREKYEGRSDYVKLHTAFGLYMLRRRRDTGQTKICEIFERIDRIGRELAPDGRYRVAVTGHSLGGALSTIFSFYAACDKRFTSLGPVRTFTFAAPRVGDVHFRAAYERLERTGRLRHARFSNIKDIVPLTPTFSVHGTIIGPWYKHVGLQVKLHETSGLGKLGLSIMKSVDAMYPRDKDWASELARALGSGANFLFNLTTLKGFGRNHSLSEHQKRLNFLYQFRRNLLEADLRGDERRKMKSMEEYYTIKGGIGYAAIVEDGKRRGTQGRHVRRAVIIILVVSVVSVVAYVFVAMCPIGIGMKSDYCAEGGWKLICGETLDIPSVEVGDDNATLATEESVALEEVDDSGVVDAVTTEKESDAAPEVSEESGNAEVDTAVEIEGESQVVEAENESQVDEPDVVPDEPVEPSSSLNATVLAIENEKVEASLVEEIAPIKESPSVPMPSPDSPVWGSRAHRRRVPVVLDQLPEARRHSEAFAQGAREDAHVVAQTHVVEAEVKERMTRSNMPSPAQFEGVEGFANRPGQVLGPLVLHFAGKITHLH